MSLEALIVLLFVLWCCHNGIKNFRKLSESDTGKAVLSNIWNRWMK